MLDVTDYELVWPPDLFAAEARRLLARPKVTRSGIDLLLHEAFLDRCVVSDLASLVDGAPWGADVGPSPSAREVLADLSDRAQDIPRVSAPRPYWGQRHGQVAPGPYLDEQKARRYFADLVEEFQDDGYLDNVFLRPCVDDSFIPERNPAAELEKRLGVAGLWPLRPGAWDDSTFYGLIEVFHDLVSRPRERFYHDFSGCGWHYSDFATTSGREVYRWKVNDLLQAAGSSYRLADSGEDTGRLVATFDDGRSELISDVLSHTMQDAAGRVRHAIALFRSREGTNEDKRSALVVLAGIHEQRRRLIKAELVSADEGALFNIANNFAIRHQDNKQSRDYDSAFLDWIFWWYLATVELTNRIISRQESQAHPAANL